ncbi:ESPR-type extended signal peptide-containing protein [Acinetobacter ursingii]|uniref:ESPR-type extended signal peptide-containing protein n=1 Tax=Acinetobacter ursingii TaxID=108980 RepID=UPI001959DE3F|nr:ESPR-type extended signal peptide-containing protein [Acinetobacter ursingii]MCH2006069.1 YadA-like family protein [Acinetobacter ursingii]VTX89630.1 Adhesin Ata autotransporter [Acinetobacter ursingii]
MNKVYRVIWNASLGAWVAVSELAKSKGKSKTVKKIAGSVVLVTTVITTVSVHAEDINEDLNVVGDITATGEITGSDVTTNSGASLNNLNSKINDTTTGLASKASQTDFNTLNNQVNNATTGLATKASKTDVTAAKTEVVQGKNINVTSATGANGQTVYTVKTADDVNFNKVTVDGTVIDDGQITVAKDGSIAAGSQQVITGNQLYELEQKLFNSGAQGVKYFHANSSLDDSAAYGADSVAVGPKAVTNKSATDSIAMGNNAVVGTKDDGTTPAPTDGVESIAIGKDTKALGDKNTVIGQAATVDSKYVTSSLALGDSAKVTGDNTNNALAIGSNSVASAASASAIGDSAQATGTNSTAIGKSSTASGGSATAIGSGSIAGAVNGTALGASAIANSNNAVSIGNNAGLGTANINVADNQNHIAIGTNAGQNIRGNENIAVGLEASNGTSGRYNISIGSKAGQSMSGEENVSIGYLSNQATTAGAFHTTALGGRTQSGSNSVAVGYSAKAKDNGAIALGTGASVEGVDNGNGGLTNADNGIAIGLNARSKDNSIAIGSGSVASREKAKDEQAYITLTKIGGEGVVSVGGDDQTGNLSFTRRITHVSDGAADYDAVNVNQLRKAQQSVANLVGGGVTVDSSTGAYSQITLKDKNGTASTYNTIADAFNAVSSGQIQLIDPAANAVTYTDSISKQVNLRPNTVISGLAPGVNGTDAVNVDQMKTSIEASRVKYVSVNSEQKSNRFNEGATGVDSVAIGSDALSGGKQSTAIGTNIKAIDQNSLAIGSNGTIAYDVSGIAIGQHAISRGENSITIGKDSQSAPKTTNAPVDDAIAIGTGAKVSDDAAVALGKNAIATGRQSFAQGTNAYTAPDASNGAAIGFNSISGAQNAYALGNAAHANTVDSIATGTNATTYATNALALGKGAVSGKANPTKDEIDNNANSDTIAIGTNSFAQIKNALAVGNTAKATEESSLALGTESQATGNSAIAQGQNAKALNTNSIAQGFNAQATAANAVAIGANATVTNANAVALGSDSVSGSYNRTTKGTINGRDYNYAGSGAGLSTVSVGTAGNERQIINVAAGRVSSTSTDAVNGSQLFAVQQEVQQPLSFAGDSGTKVDRKLGDQLKVTGGATGTLTDGNIGVVANGSDTLQLKLAKDVNLTSAGSLTVRTTKLTDGKVEIKDSSNNSNVSTSTNTVMTAGTSTNTIDANSITLKNATNNVVLSGSTGTLNGLTNKTLTVPGFATQGRAATEEQLKLVNDTANKGWNITTNKDTANKSNVAPDATVDFSNSDKNITVSHSGTNVDLKLAEVVNIGGQPGGATISVNGKSGTITGLTNKTFDPNNYTTGRAATEDQLATPLTFTGDNTGVNVQRKLGQQLSIVGGESVAANLTDNNIGVVADSTNNKLTVKLSKDIKLNSVNAAGTVIDSKGLTFVNSSGGAIPNSPSISATGINAGTNKITNVGAGAITDTSMDAVNGSQIKGIIDKGFTVSSNGNTAAKDTIALGENVDFSATDTNIKVTNTGNNQITFGLEPVVKVGPATGGSPVTINGNTGQITGLTNKTTTSSDFATVGRAATEEQLKTIQTGLTDSGFGLKAADSNTVNKKLGETIDIVGADSNITTKVVNGQVAVELSKNIDLSKAGSLTVGNTKVTDGKVELKDGAKSNSSTVDGTVVSDGTNTTTVGASQITVGAGSNPIIINGATGRVSGLTNTTWDPNATYNQKQAATEEQLKSVSDVAQNANKGWKFTSTNKGGVASAAQKIAPDETLDFNNTDGNIKLAATANNLTVNLNPDVNLTSAGSLTVGSSSIKNNEVKVGSNTLTDNGLTVGSTNVTSGNVTGLTNKTTTSSDFATVGRAATEEQLKTIQTGLTDSGFGLKAADSNTVNKKLGETIDIVGADSNITTKVVNGQVAVELSKNIDLSKAGSLTVGNTKVTDGKIELKDGAKSNSSTVDGTTVTDGTNSSTIGAGSISVSNGTNQTLIGATQVVVGGASPVTLNGATGRVSGLTNTAWDPNATYNQKQAATEEQLKSVSDVAQNANKGWNVKSDSTLASTQVKPEDTVDIGLANDEKNLKVAAINSNGTTTIDFSLSKDLLLDSVNAGGTVIDKGGLRFVDPITGLPLSNTPSISLGGINAGNQIISNVAPGKNGTDAVNVNQLNDVKAIAEEGWVFTTATSGKGQTVNSSLQTIKPNQRFTMISGDNVELIQNGDKVTITTTPEVNFDKVTVGNVVIDKTTNKITGVEAGTVAANSKDVVNGSQLHDLGSGVQNIIGGNTTYDPNTGTYTNNNIGDTGQNNINDAIKSINDTAQNANKGWTVSTNGQNASQVKPTDTVDFANKDGNIKVNNTGNNITVDLAKDIQVDSVTAGDTTVNNNGLTINGGPSVTKNGIDAAGNKVTGVAEGSIAQGSKDAVNGSQIHDIIGDGAFQGGDGNTITNIGGTGATNINDAIGSINQKAGQHSTVEAGQNITVKESTNSNGGKEYTVATADDVKFNSVTSNTVTANNVKVGDVNIDQNGINAGNHKITNVAPGEISSTSIDAVNGSQLNTSNQYIVNSLGGGAKYENGQFTGPTYNVNNGSYNNVGDALGALNQADINLGNRITNLGDRLEQVFYNVNGRIDDVEKKANAGIASAMALEGAPFVAGKFTYAVGAAYHGGENAVGATLRKTADNGRWSITGGVAAASQGDPSVRVGISGVID